MSFNEANTVERMILESVENLGQSPHAEPVHDAPGWGDSIGDQLRPARWPFSPATQVPRQPGDVMVESWVREALLRLNPEIAFWSDRWMRLKDDQEAGKDVRLNLDNIQRTINDLEGRSENRRKELQSMRHVTNGTPVVLGGALVVPIGLLRKLRDPSTLNPQLSAPTPPPAHASSDSP